MNIFVTSYDPSVCARVLDDKRVVKMVLESAQLLSTAMHVMEIPDAPYRKTHTNHPCGIWVRESRENFLWLLEHMRALDLEYFARYKRVHKCHFLLPIFSNASQFFEPYMLTNFSNCTNYKEVQDVRSAYVWQLRDKWDNDKRRPTWYGTDERPF